MSINIDSQLADFTYDTGRHRYGLTFPGDLQALVRGTVLSAAAQAYATDMFGEGTAIAGFEVQERIWRRRCRWG